MLRNNSSDKIYGGLHLETRATLMLTWDKPSSTFYGDNADSSTKYQTMKVA